MRQMERVIVVSVAEFSGMLRPVTSIELAAESTGNPSSRERLSVGRVGQSSPPETAGTE